MVAISCGRPEGQKRLVVKSVYPRCVPANRQTRITISGDRFDKSDRVLFGRLPGSNIAVSSAQHLLVDAPPASEGSVQLTLIAPDGERHTVVNGITYRPPETFDPNGDCRVDVADVFYLARYVKGTGPPPILSGDANGDGAVDRRDIDYLVKYLFEGGPPPVDKTARK